MSRFNIYPFKHMLCKLPAMCIDACIDLQRDVLVAELYVTSILMLATSIPIKYLLLFLKKIIIN